VLPESRFAVTLIASLVLWFPTALVLLSGDIDGFGASVRYVLGLLIAWIAVAVLDRLITAYVAGQGRTREAEAAQSTTTDS
jgi:hypothetical protein